MVKAAAMRKRYVLFELRSAEPAEEEALKRALYAEALRFFGELGMSRAAFKLVEFDAKANRGIIRCERSHLDTVLGFLALVSSLDGKIARVRSLKSSGTIAALKRE
jgi:RNase P/RNase MRP subunit POP5